MSLTAHDIMDKVFGWSSKPYLDVEICMSEFKDLVNKADVKDLGDRIYFIREFRRIVHSLPLKIYVNQDTRNNLLTAMQRVLDEAIDEEEDNAERDG